MHSSKVHNPSHSPLRCSENAAKVEELETAGELGYPTRVPRVPSMDKGYPEYPRYSEEFLGRES
eukprot:1184521-Rhodomonas_salina.2